MRLNVNTYKCTHGLCLVFIRTYVYKCVVCVYKPLDLWWIEDVHKYDKMYLCVYLYVYCFIIVSPEKVTEKITMKNTISWTYICIKINMFLHILWGITVRRLVCVYKPLDLWWIEDIHKYDKMYLWIIDTLSKNIFMFLLIYVLFLL